MQYILEDTLWEACTFLDYKDLLNVSLTCKSLYDTLNNLLIPSRFIDKFNNDIKLIEDEHIDSVIESFMSSHDKIFKKYISDNINFILSNTCNITLLHLLYKEFDYKFSINTVAHRRYNHIYKFTGDDEDYDTDFTLLYSDIYMLSYNSKICVVNSILFILKVIEDGYINYIIDNLHNHEDNIMLMLFCIEMSIQTGSFFHNDIPIHVSLTMLLLDDEYRNLEKHHFIFRYLVGVAIEYKVPMDSYRLREYDSLQLSDEFEYAKYNCDHYVERIKTYDRYRFDIYEACVFILNDPDIDYASLLHVPKRLGSRFKDIVSIMNMGFKRYIPGKSNPLNGNAI